MVKMTDLYLVSYARRSLYQLLILSSLVYGCAGRQAVVAVSGTVIGVEISQNAANQSPQAKLGYNRGEIAVVPTNRSGDVEPAGHLNGARDVADVLMEIRYGGIFDTGPTSGIYQRLAVGSNAVVQPGASLMFAKDAAGNVSEKTTEILKSLQSIPAPDASSSREQLTLANAFRDTPDEVTRGKFDAAAKATRVFADFDAFLTNRPRQPTMSEAQSVRKQLESQGIKFN
jgi:hypothetical protein